SRDRCRSCAATDACSGERDRVRPPREAQAPCASRALAGSRSLAPQERRTWAWRMRAGRGERARTPASRRRCSASRHFLACARDDVNERVYLFAAALFGDGNQQGIVEIGVRHQARERDACEETLARGVLAHCGRIRRQANGELLEDRGPVEQRFGAGVLDQTIARVVRARDALLPHLAQSLWSVPGER